MVLVRAINYKSTIKKPMMSNEVQCETQPRRPEFVPPPEPVEVEVGVVVEPVGEWMLDDPDVVLILPLSGVVHCTPSGKLFPSPIRMSMH